MVCKAVVVGRQAVDTSKHTREEKKKIFKVALTPETVVSCVPVAGNTSLENSPLDSSVYYSIGESRHV
jgi:hypothetical protein